jgi:hypothetical protein
LPVQRKSKAFISKPAVVDSSAGGAKAHVGSIVPPANRYSRALRPHCEVRAVFCKKMNPSRSATHRRLTRQTSTARLQSPEKLGVMSILVPKAMATCNELIKIHSDSLARDFLPQCSKSIQELLATPEHSCAFTRIAGRDNADTAGISWSNSTGLPV